LNLTFFTFDNAPFKLRAARVERDWMSATPGNFAYRCLPLNIANSGGWEILNNTKFSSVWDGGNKPNAVRVFSKSPCDASAHFGCGILTFSISCLIQSSSKVNLWVGGPVNSAKDGISPLTAIVETNWSPYSFTMNWRFTRPDHEVTFEKDEPICHIFPISMDLLEATSPNIEPIQNSPCLEKQHDDWSIDRRRFNTELPIKGSAAESEKWQRLYQRGLFPDGKPTEQPHRTKVRLKVIKDFNSNRAE